MKNLKAVLLLTISFFSILLKAQIIKNPVTTNVQLSGLSSPLSLTIKSNAFSLFNPTDDGDNKVNAYLLSYLCYMMYPDPLSKEVGFKIDKLDDATFSTQFAKKIEPLFWDGTTAATKPTISSLVALPTMPAGMKDVARDAGMDPEAVVISTPTTIFVVFRGTDDVPGISAAQVFSLGLLNSEFIGSDFQAPLYAPTDAVMPGKVHVGFWKSLSFIRTSLDNIIKAADDPLKPKQIWVTGHSLGASQAQLYAMYLMNNGPRIPSSRIHCFTFNGTSFNGNQAYANAVNVLGTKFQRFEFRDDIVSSVNPSLADFVNWSPANPSMYYNIARCMGTNCPSESYAKSGKRNWYTDANNHVQNATERSAGETTLSPNSGCDHDVYWICDALLRTLTADQKKMMPTISFAPNSPQCSFADFATTITNLSISLWNTINLAANDLSANYLGGLAGTYKIISKKYKNFPNKYLSWDGNTGSQLTLSSTPTLFSIGNKTIAGIVNAGGYVLAKSSNYAASDPTYSFGLPTGTENSNMVFMKQATNLGIIGDEMTWFLYKVPSPANNQFVLYNWNTRKVLKAPDACVTGGSCRVYENTGLNNDRGQVWILERQ